MTNIKGEYLRWGRVPMINGVVVIGATAIIAITVLAVFLIGVLERGRFVQDKRQVYLNTIKALVMAIEEKDTYTQKHSANVAVFSAQIAETMGFDQKQIDRIYIAALLHDIGKIGVPEALINKCGPLSAEEYDLVKQHPADGVKIIERIGFSHDIIAAVCEHHECWDGGGYLIGLRGCEIPVFARIIAIADTIDAMSTTRPYRQAMPVDVILQELEKESGAQFDPEITRVAIKLVRDGLLNKGEG